MVEKWVWNSSEYRISCEWWSTGHMKFSVVEKVHSCLSVEVQVMRDQKLEWDLLVIDELHKANQLLVMVHNC